MRTKTTKAVKEGENIEWISKPDAFNVEKNLPLLNARLIFITEKIFICPKDVRNAEKKIKKDNQIKKIIP